MGATMTWFARQMQSYSKGGINVTYKYDSDGLRTQKVVNGVEHNYYYVGDQLRYERYSDSYEIYYNYDADGRPCRAYKKDLIAGKNYSYYLITNTRGDVIETRDGDGNVNAKFLYDSWGKLISVTDGNGNTLATDSFAYQISLKYRGYVYDSETGLYYLQSRYYDPETGRFLNADNVNYLGISESILSYNAFVYCENNPMNKNDSLGCFPITMGAAFLSSALFFVATLAVTNLVLNSYLTNYSFQNQLRKNYNNIKLPMLTPQGRINLLSKIIRTFTGLSVKFIIKSINVAVAEAKIRETVTRNSRNRYWSATIRAGYVDIGKALSYSEALNELKKGNNIFTVTRVEARALAMDAYNNKTPIGPQIDNGKEDVPGYYYHYHVFGRKYSGAHIFYLF